MAAQLLTIVRDEVVLGTAPGVSSADEGGLFLRCEGRPLRRLRPWDFNPFLKSRLTIYVCEVHRTVLLRHGARWRESLSEHAEDGALLACSATLSRAQIRYRKTLVERAARAMRWA